MTSRPERPCVVRRMGDSALVVSFEERIAPEINAQAVRLAMWLRGERLLGVRDVVESYCAVTLHIDPLAVDVDLRDLNARSGSGARRDDTPRPERATPSSRCPCATATSLGPTSKR